MPARKQDPVTHAIWGNDDTPQYRVRSVCGVMVSSEQIDNDMPTCHTCMRDKKAQTPVLIDHDSQERRIVTTLKPPMPTVGMQIAEMSEFDFGGDA